MNLSTYITGGLALVCAGLYFMWSIEAKKVERRDDLIAAHQAVEQMAAKAVTSAQAAAKESAAALESVKADLDRQAQTAAKFETIARNRDKALRDALKRIANAPSTEDGPVAPVLARELEQLRVVAGPAGPATSPDSDRGDPSGALPDLDRPDMPAAPPAS